MSWSPFSVTSWCVFLLFGACLLSSTVWAQSTGFFRTDGPEILDSQGTPVVIKGIGLGGWLMPEGYMLHISAPDGGSPRTIRAQIEDLIGPADTDRFFELYRAHYVAEKDIAQIAAWGFDHIRLPFHYNLFFDPDTETFKEDGFTLLDTFLEWCRTHGLYVILDMHAAPGAQSEHNIADSDGEARLWTEPVPYQDQTVTIWTEIARRYANETQIIGYDLINEPVTPDGITGFDLRALYERIAASIRTVDTNHILFIEGNFFATHFPELIPPFDDNMVYTFHKYWNGTGLNSIQYLVDIRSDTNTPLWLGETGENSNTWFYNVTRLMEEHRIGTNWWTHKKIETTTSPLSSPFAPGYEDVIAYWRGQGPRPSAAAARDALFAMARGLDLDSAVVRPGVLAAWFNADFSTQRIPFKDHRIPGVIHAVDYDLGNHGTTYSDSDIMATSGSPGGGNTGGQYRNDGVDIERSTDPQGFGYNVGWTERLEWLSYTVQVETSGIYDIDVRVASSGGGQFMLSMDGTRLGEIVNVPNTGGWQNWRTVQLQGVELAAGEHILQFTVRRNNFNINNMTFTLVSATDTQGILDRPTTPFNLDTYPNPSGDIVNVDLATPAAGRVRLEVVDLLGRRVFTAPWQNVPRGTHTLRVRPQLASGLYILRAWLEEPQSAVHRFSKPLVVQQ